MKKILNITSSVQGEKSFSNKLSNAILEEITAVYPDAIIHTRDLTKNPVPHLEGLHFTAFNTPDTQRTAPLKEAIQSSDTAVKEIQDADVIVIGVPLYNFGIPSTLKAWIDHIIRAGLTFSYENGVPEGLLKHKKVYLSIATGWIYTEGAMKDFDFTEPYLRMVLGFIGLTDITVFRVEGTAIPGIQDTAWPKALDHVHAYTY